MRDIHSNDLGELPVLQQLTEETALAASEVENAFCADTAQRGDHRTDTLVGQTNGPFNLLFLARASFS